MKGGARVELLVVTEEHPEGVPVGVVENFAPHPRNGEIEQLDPAGLTVAAGARLTWSVPIEDLLDDRCAANRAWLAKATDVLCASTDPAGGRFEFTVGVVSLRRTMTAWTDCPLTPEVSARRGPVRQVVVLGWEDDKRMRVSYRGVEHIIKRAYLYRRPGRWLPSAGSHKGVPLRGGWMETNGKWHRAPLHLLPRDLIAAFGRPAWLDPGERLHVRRRHGQGTHHARGGRQ